ncbi:hypothetical protein cypCar_00003893 [Cyprinus carpio]|nr:hypothetical protein cypCar_00003893 [Cyprinus carpio]
MDMPGRGLYDERDSGIARSASLSSLLITPFPSPGSSLTSSCASSYQRRWLRSQTTSLENGVFPRWSVEESFNMSDENGGPSLGVARKKKIAIGVIFLLSPNEEENAKFQDFFFSHFPLFESHMNKLKSAIEQAMILSRRSADASQRALAYSRMVDGLNEFSLVQTHPEIHFACNKVEKCTRFAGAVQLVTLQSFLIISSGIWVLISGPWPILPGCVTFGEVKYAAKVFPGWGSPVQLKRSLFQLLTKALLSLCVWTHYRTTICNLYIMPRVSEPVWLTMMSGPPEKNQLCGQFMRELALLMEQASKNQLSNIPPSASHCGSHKPSRLGSHGHAQRSATLKDIPGEALLTKCGHAGENASLQPTLGTAW